MKTNRNIPASDIVRSLFLLLLYAVAALVWCTATVYPNNVDMDMQKISYTPYSEFDRVLAVSSLLNDLTTLLFRGLCIVFIIYLALMLFFTRSRLVVFIAISMAIIVTSVILKNPLNYIASYREPDISARAKARGMRYVNPDSIINLGDTLMKDDTSTKRP